jgi:hypothetical protein
VKRKWSWHARVPDLGACASRDRAAFHATSRQLTRALFMPLHYC